MNKGLRPEEAVREPLCYELIDARVTDLDEATDVLAVVSNDAVAKPEYVHVPPRRATRLSGPLGREVCPRWTGVRDAALL